MQRMYVFFCLLISGICPMYSQDTISGDTVVNCTNDTFKELISAGDGIIIDLRTAEEVKKGYIKGAVNIDFLDTNFEKEIAKLDKGKACYIYCESGGRSEEAAAYMQKQGFKKIYNLEKGFFGWKRKGFGYISP